MKKQILIVEDNINLWKDIKSQIEKTGSLLATSKDKVYKISNDSLEVYLSWELQTAKKIIESKRFDVYFLDNQIYDSSVSQKVLSHDELLETIRKRSEGIVPVIYNISSHESPDIQRRCQKNGKTILEEIQASIIDAPKRV
jgi:CheY-like chemotaxis protein